MIKIIGRRILSLINPRYNYLPQMEEYDNLSQDFALYSMFTHTKNFSGFHITTDNYGFRYSEFENKLISLETELFSQKKTNLIIGGSTVFGVGASNDQNTISSYLSKKTNERWINIGLRAGNSFQEYLNLIKILGKLKNIGEIVFLSGLNDIYMNLAFDKSNFLDDLIFNQTDIENFMNKFRLSQHSRKKIILASFISVFKKVKTLDIIHLKTVKDMINFKKVKTSLKKESEDELFSIFERNFLLYSALEKTLKNTSIYFFLQPYFYWVDKKSNLKEDEIIEYLNNKSETSSYIYKKINSSLHNKVSKKLNDFSQKYKLNFFDLNNENFGSKEDFIFADRVHLTDLGNKITAEMISKYIQL